MAPTTKRKKTSKPAHPIPANGSPGNNKLPLRSKEDEIQTQSEEVQNEILDAATTSKKGSLMIFDDDGFGALDKTFITGKPVKNPQSEVIAEADDQSSDDEAPEAIGTRQAAAEVKISTRAADRAAQEQTQAERRKRKEKDALFKQQASARRKAEQSQPPEVSAGRLRAERPRFPVHLPAEYLTDSSSEDEDDNEGSGELRNVRPKRRKVAAVEKRLTRLDDAPRDEALGSSIYQVAKKVDTRLAPKTSQRAHSIKSQLLRRNRPAVKSRPGFFVGS